MDQTLSERALRVTVIIPTFNDRTHIDRAIADARALGDVQIVVADSGSTDGTIDRARQQGVRVLDLAGDRGRCIRAAAGNAAGDVIVVAPADVSLPPNACAQLAATFEQPAVLAGVFRCRFAASFPRRSGLNILYRFLSWIGLLPHGAAWFYWRTAGESETGPRSLRVFEDLDLLWRISRQGTVVTVRSPATIHARHEGHRLIWTLAGALYHMGISPRLLGQFYRKPTDDRQSAVIAAEDAARIESLPMTR